MCLETEVSLMTKYKIQWYLRLLYWGEKIIFELKISSPKQLFKYIQLQINISWQCILIAPILYLNTPNT